MYEINLTEDALNLLTVLDATCPGSMEDLVERALNCYTTLITKKIEGHSMVNVNLSDSMFETLI